MAKSTMKSPDPEDGLFFVLQPNETGATGSHQKGEIHVRKSQIGGFLPDLSGPTSTVDRSIRVLNAKTGEWGDVTYTHYGGRSSPEDRLRQFPAAWQGWETDDVVILVPLVAYHAVLYIFKPEDEIPAGLGAAWKQIEQGATHGIFAVGKAKRRVRR